MEADTSHAGQSLYKACAGRKRSLLRVFTAACCYFLCTCVHMVDKIPEILMRKGARAVAPHRQQDVRLSPLLTFCKNKVCRVVRWLSHVLPPVAFPRPPPRGLPVFIVCHMHSARITGAAAAGAFLWGAASSHLAGGCGGAPPAGVSGPASFRRHPRDMN